MKDIPDFYAAIQHCQIEAQLAGSHYQRIADDLGRALSILAGGGVEQTRKANGRQMPGCRVCAEMPAARVASHTGSGEPAASSSILADSPAGHPDAASPLPPASGPSFSDGPWLGGSNGERDVFDTMHRFPKERWTI